MRKQQALFLAALLVGLLTVTAARVARADFDNEEAFKEDVRSSPVTCHDEASCLAQGLVLVSLFDAKETSTSTAPEVIDALPRLTLIAQDQATIWADTILEGSYEAEGGTGLDKVEGILRNGRLVSYRITYSERAWQLGEDNQREKAGRIVESSFVSKTLRSWLRDEESLATFR